MKKLAIVITSHKGHTKKVAVRLAERMSSDAVRVDVFNVLDSASAETLDIKLYDGFLIGGPVYYGEFPEQLLDFVSENIQLLNEKSVGFFSVGLSPSCRGSVRQFLVATSLKPRHIACIEGAVSFTQSGWIGRQALRYFSRSYGVSFDPSQDHEMTDWNLVDRFADDFLANRTEVQMVEDQDSVTWGSLEAA